MKPKSVHVYREYAHGGSCLLVCEEKREDHKGVTQYQEYLGEYVLRGPIVRERWEVRAMSGTVYAFADRRAAILCRKGLRTKYKERGVGEDLVRRIRVVHIVTRKVAK